MARKRWADLSPRTRTIITTGAVVEGALKVLALADLARRSDAEVRGSKRAWATALTVVNAAGAVPVAYLLRGRR